MDLIERQKAIDALQKEINKAIPPFSDVVGSIRCGVRLARNIIEDLPSAQQDTDEWCYDCKEYDNEKHCCPRWNRVIRQTLKDAQLEQWIPCSERLPENRLYVLVTYKYEYGLIDHGITWYGQAEEKWDTSREVIAWMPLPDPYRAERRTDNANIDT